MLPSRRALGAALIALLAVPGCGGADRDVAPQGPPQPVPQFFDFGMIPHGAAGEHDFVLDTRHALGADYFALGTHIDCSCGRAQLLLRAANGVERTIEVYGPDAIPADGEVLVVRMQVDTARKEPVDFGPVDSRAVVQFQHRDARDGNARVPWPLNFRYGIDSPVRVRPYAVLDFERVAMSVPVTLLTTLQSDLPNRPICFGPVHCDDARVQVSLEQKGDATWLRATMTPRGDDAGYLRTLVTIDTDLESGYRVQLAAIAQITPDLVALPIAKISIRDDLRRAQPVERAQSQYLLVSDRDPSRPVEFAIARFVDTAGHDASQDFEVTFEPVPGDERSRRMRLRWIGHAESEFRGEIVLAKDPRNGPFLPIEVVALHAQKP